MELCGKKLERAKQLIDGLAGEKDRWTQFVEDLGTQFDNLTGVCVCVCVYAYLCVCVCLCASSLLTLALALVQILTSVTVMLSLTLKI